MDVIGAWHHDHMDNGFVVSLVAIVCCAAAGFGIGWLLRGARAHSTQTAQTLETQRQLATSEQQVAVLTARLDSAAATIASSEERLREAKSEVADLQRLATAQTAAETEKAKAQLAQEGKVLAALAPVTTRLEAMQQKIAALESQRQEQYGTLSEQLAAARRSDDALRNTTNALAAALKSNSTRGAWGEAQLRNIVESAGLTERVDFSMQTSFTTEDGRKRPDMLLRIPGGKSLAVDAKVPFSAFIAANEIPETASGEALAKREQLMQEHVKALRKHIDQLASKSYWDLVVASPEFVVAFIPSESLLSAALSTDLDLLDYAFSKRVVLASPVTLWSVLKTVAYMWRQEDLTSEAREIIGLAKELYGRIATMSGYTEKLRKSLENSVKAFNQFSTSLEHRVLVTARRLDKVDDARVIQELPTIESTTQPLTALEFVNSTSDQIEQGSDAPHTAEAQGNEAPDEPGQDEN